MSAVGETEARDRDGAAVSARRRRPALFSGFCIENGLRRRLRRDELTEAYRLWTKHRDIREGRESGVGR